MRWDSTGMSEAHPPISSILDSRRNLSRKIKCPGCKSAHIKFTEHHPGPVERFEQRDDYSIQCLGKDEDMTGERYVVAHCQVCSAEWRVRGLTRVRDLKYASFIPRPPEVAALPDGRNWDKPSRQG
ncbi:hypothetical protein Dgeo_3097 (plasmid) [Deinococcus geothermalis DSM 11300]|uniref:Uncharacterized protein n=2 Tax=Deinococcaceae TaxID=183710 RepID=A8ZRM8_DEIGD|nr:hypothetical protein Dgeo_3097 [Deinococcus geothermalis DSM 11300]